jgi:hypothetical protein
MHLRRALVLFAIVVGLAALVAALSPRPKTETLVPPTPTAPPSTPPASPTARVALDLTQEKHVKRHVPPGAHLILTVQVPEPGDVSFMSSVQAAEQHTPATFDVLMPQSGSFEVEFAPSGGGPGHGATVSVSG